MMPTWYQTLVAIFGLLLFIIAYKELWTAVILVSGVVLVGIGEWINHRWEMGVIPGMRAMKAPSNNRAPNWLGWTFDGAGALLILVGALRLLQQW